MTTPMTDMDAGPTETSFVARLPTTAIRISVTYRPTTCSRAQRSAITTRPPSSIAEVSSRPSSRQALTRSKWLGLRDAFRDSAMGRLQQLREQTDEEHRRGEGEETTGRPLRLRGR